MLFSLRALAWRKVLSRLTFVALSAACMSGCDTATSTSTAPSATSTVVAATEARPIHLLVVDDARLAEVARREWAAVSEAKLELTNLTTEEFVAQLATKSLSADAIIYPTSWLGTLAESALIGPMPRRNVDSEAFAADDILPWVRRGELSWGKDVCAVPLGSVVLTMITKNVAAETTATESQTANENSPEQQVPQTWSELAAWRGGKLRIAQPLAEGWASRILLARSAAYVRNRGQVSTLFDYSTMEPLIDSPPYVRALEELVAASQSQPKQLDWDPWDVEQALWDDECDVGITWMSPAATKPSRNKADETNAGSKSNEGNEEVDGANESVSYDWSFAELPGSREIYQNGDADWTKRSDESVAHVTLVGLSGRVGSVLRSSRRQRAAWNFLVKLSAEDLSYRVSSTSRFTGPFRRSQQAARAWVDKRISSSDAREYGIASSAGYSRNLAFPTLRIPGHEKYMQSLDTAVRAAVAGDGEPAALLQQVADDWRKLTTELGVESQRTAFSRNLGIEP